MCTAVCVLRTYLSATYSYYSTAILLIPNVAHARSETFTALRFLCRRLHFLASYFFFFCTRLLAACAAARPCVCYQAVSGWVKGSGEKLQEMGCLRAREFDIISIWTSGGQSRRWIGPAEAQVSERLSLWRKESTSTTRRWDTQRECRERRCAQVQALLVMTRREKPRQPSPCVASLSLFSSHPCSLFFGHAKKKNCSKMFPDPEVPRK